MTRRVGAGYGTDPAGWRDVFDGPDAGAPVLARSDVEPGPVVQTLTFTAPAAPGDHLFHCDPHPTLVAGTSVVG